MTRVPTLRIALCAALVALVPAASGEAASGGVAGPGGGDGGCAKAKFGDRALERGDCGGDVETLNWLLRAADFRVGLERRFRVDTHDAVRSLQRRRDLRADGVVDRATRRVVVGTMGRQTASWYGPGFYGNRTACGQTLRRRTVGVAHRTLPCGTKVVFGYEGRFVRTRVIDRGPFVKRDYERDWDLTAALADRLGFEGVDRVRAAPIR